ncbi:MAG: hypothetical protein KUL78_01425 [Flavobacterium sp.]|jgi:hypothetical protein|nr:hypothetical protein [Flavobacterium sp.]
MPRLNSEIKEQIKKLDYYDLKDIVLKLASKEKIVYDFVINNYLDKESGEKELFEITKSDLEIIFRKRYKGFSEQLQLANMLRACIKRINEFTKISKNKVLEADLLLHILEIPFSLTTNMFGTCFTQYDTKVAMILNRLINIVTKKLHEDYKIEYEDKINDYLQILHRTSSHIDTVYNLPKAI